MGEHPLFARRRRQRRGDEAGRRRQRRRRSTSRTARWCSRATSLTVRRPDLRRRRSTAGRRVRAITPSAGEMLPDVRFGDYEQFSFKGWNDDTVHGYVVKPWNYQAGQEVSGRVPDPRRPAGQLRQPLELPLEPADLRGPGLRRGDDRLPRLHRLRPGVHRRDQPALGRPPARGPAEGLGRGAAEVRRSSTATAPARSAPATAATWSTGSPATGTSRGSAWSTTTASSTAA